jgi:hypothetical protein
MVLYPAAADGDHGRPDHDGKDRVPQAGHDPRGDLQLVQGREGPEDQHRDPGALGHDQALETPPWKSTASGMNELLLARRVGRGGAMRARQRVADGSW